MPELSLTADGAAPQSKVADKQQLNHLGLLLDRVRQQEDVALEQLYQATIGRVFGLSRRLLGNDADAEEIACDVYVYVWSHAKNYDSERGTVLAWLLTICRSRSLDLIRKRKRHEELDVPQLSDADVAESSELLVDMMEAGSQVKLALQALPMERRQALALAYLRGLSHKEISVVLSLPVGTVKSHVKRGLDAVARLVAKP